MKKLITSILSVFALFHSMETMAQWSTDPAVNTTVCTAVGDQRVVTSTPDGEGGMIVAWQDKRGPNDKLYAQKIDRTGTIKWATNGIVFCNAINNQFLSSTSLPDGEGGIILVWTDFRNGLNTSNDSKDIYAQRINADGVPQWANNGIVICNAAKGQEAPLLVTDGAGGAIVLWTDFRNGIDANIFAQKINFDGEIQWVNNGKQISAQAADQNIFSAIYNNEQGVVMLWYDNRSLNTYQDLYVQLINLEGETQWDADGIPICQNANQKYNPVVINGGSGGALLFWDENGRNNVGDDIYGQSINKLGEIQWEDNGMIICALQNDQSTPKAIGDGEGGAIVAWYDARSNVGNIYCQRINAVGSPQWTVDGNLIGSESQARFISSIYSDEKGGAILAWVQIENLYDELFYAQRIDSSGESLWDLDGVGVATFNSSKFDLIGTPDGTGGVLFTWGDLGAFPSNAINLYAQNICGSGELGSTVPLAPSPINGSTNTCAGSTNIYNVTAETGLAYNWTLPEGWTGTSNTNSITATSGTTGGAISVTASNGCGNSFSSNLQIEVSTGSGSSWSTNTLENNSICTSADAQEFTKITSDGAGGSIIVWQDKRNGSTYDVYAQRINSLGVSVWAANGVVISGAANNQISPQIVSDGVGGAIVSWEDYRSGTSDIYAQRINLNGNLQWTINGVSICAAAQNQLEPKLVPIESEGAIITWQDFRSGTNFDIYAQRINSNGSNLWNANGIAICSAAGDQQFPNLVKSVSNGAIFTWQDKRNLSSFDIYSQRITDTGAVQWVANGLAVCNSANDQLSPVISQTTSNGAIITWQDKRNGSDFNIYSQRIKSNGAVQWAANGVSLCSAPNDQASPRATILSAAGSSIVTWQDVRNGNSDVYSQKINANGTNAWAADGVAICNVSGDQKSPQIVSDGSGGAIVTWQDKRGVNNDIYAQRISTNGSISWSANGSLISNATSDQQFPALVSEGNGGAIIAWKDKRNGSTTDIFTQKVCPLGSIGGSLPDAPSQIVGLQNICSGSTNQFSTPIACNATSYNWVIPNGWSFVGEANGNIVTLNANGNSGIVSVKANNGCGNSASISKSIVVIGCWLESDQTVNGDTLLGAVLYPNPTNEKLTIQTNDVPDKLIVTDILGKEILQITPTSNISKIELLNQKNGFYFIKIFTGDVQTTMRFVLNK